MMELIISQVVNGLVWGLILALISIGLTLIYGQLEIVNVAHGALYTVGAVVSYYAFASMGGWCSLSSCRRSYWLCWDLSFT